MSDAPAARPRLMHPLCGSDLRTLSTVLARHGPVAANRLPQAGLAVLVALARWPFSSLERLAVAWRRRRLPPARPPVFIIGHWRSGTTHLYNVMSRSPAFAYVPPLATGLPWDLLGIASVLRPLLERALPGHRFIDAIPVNPDSPQEDEIALANMTALSFYHGLYFPRRLYEEFDRGVFFDHLSDGEVARWKATHVYFLDKLRMFFGDRQLLIKNPVYTARIAVLREIWPDAKFIHIHRNPYVVFNSMRNFYAALLRELALQPMDGIDLDEFILASYARLMDRFVRESDTLPPGSLVEVRFEDFEVDPLGEIARIYEVLGLDGFAEARPEFEAYLASVQGYRKHSYSFPPETVDAVRRHLGAVLERWHYDLPEATRPA